jgi:DNA integrity scanning protein DisA with diadenylate cyclase activity
MAEELLRRILGRARGVNRTTLRKVISLCIEIAREGREGRKVGTMFVVSDAENVLKHSKPLILDPLFGHPDSAKHIDDANMRETIKELALLDGAFVVSDDGVCISATRYINASVEDIELPLGLGSRHVAAASITKRTGSVAVVVSESSKVRVFFNGEIVAEITPEVWLIKQHGRRTGRSRAGQTDGGITAMETAKKTG